MRTGLVLMILVGGCAARGLPITGDLDGGSHHPVDLAVPHDGGVHDFGVADLAAPRDMAAPPDLAGPVSSAPCLTGGSVVYLDGDPGDFIHPGAQTLAVSSWSALNSGTSDTFWYEANVSSNDWWDFAFSSAKQGAPLAVGRYDNATRYPFEAAGAPGLDVTGDGRGCNMSSGWFEIESIAGGPGNGSFTELTATFEQHCENGVAALRGCIHFEN